MLIILTVVMIVILVGVLVSTFVSYKRDPYDIERAGLLLISTVFSIPCWLIVIIAIIEIFS